MNIHPQKLSKIFSCHLESLDCYRLKLVHGDHIQTVYERLTDELVLEDELVLVQLTGHTVLDGTLAGWW